MPPRRPLPPHYILDSEEKNARCMICDDGWIVRSGYRQHDQSDKHQKNAQLVQERQMREEQNRQLLQQTYNPEDRAELEEMDVRDDFPATPVNMDEPPPGLSHGNLGTFISEDDGQAVLDAAAGFDESWEAYRARMKRDESAWADFLTCLSDQRRSDEDDTYIDETIAYVKNFFSGG
ncbi:hypothetical protein AURDEDRAFT_172916 [Auricularia subglabra TFB-10046 SS5]|nr:hypothetical protein AURDEDRAFT_172916 [Auricularia subglabra TFB-10046 SS5]